MRTLSNFDFLDLWERGSRLHPLDRALLTLAAALPAERYDALAEWPLGRRNAALAQLRRACFGQTLEGWVICPQCGEKLEFAMDTASLANQDDSPIATQITIGERIFRLPTSRDLASIAKEGDAHAAALHLLQQCCLNGAELSEEDLETIGDRLAQADPLAETLLNLNCTECGNQWNEPFDITAWLWTEIEAHARRLLVDVHTLATAYGWHEREILSLSDPRRALYLEMVQA